MEKLKRFRLGTADAEMFWQVKIDKELHHRFKVEAVKQSLTMNALVAKVIREYLKKGGVK